MCCSKRERRAVGTGKNRSRNSKAKSVRFVPKRPPPKGLYLESSEGKVIHDMFGDAGDVKVYRQEVDFTLKWNGKKWNSSKQGSGVIWCMFEEDSSAHMRGGGRKREDQSESCGRCPRTLGDPTPWRGAVKGGG